MSEREDQRLFEALFNQMILSLNEAAMVQLGKIVNPVTGNTERDVAQARGTIDLLRMLKAKTEGNLNEAERRLLEQSVLNLQMNFVYEQEQETRAADRKDEPAAEAGTPAGTEAESSVPEQEPEEEPPPGNRPGENN